MRIERLVEPAADGPAAGPSVTRAGTGHAVRAAGYTYEFLCNARADKRIVPMVADIAPRGPLSPDDLNSHEGEETIYVLDGVVELVVASEAPLRLRPGDCAYLDSPVPHGLRAIDGVPARVFWASTQFGGRP